MVQDDIARSVVKALRATLLGEAADSDASGRAHADVDRAAKGRSTDPEAHRLYLLAQRWSIRLFADQYGGQPLTTPFEVSPDGTEFFVRHRHETTSAATLIVNWQVLLKQATTP